MSIITNPVLTVTAFEGTSLERTLYAPINMSQADALKLAAADCLLQAQAIEEEAGVELHITALEKAQGKKLTKAQRELVTMSYNLANGEAIDEQVEQEEPEEEEEVVEEPTNETSNETSSSEGTDTSTEPSGVEADPEPESKPEPTTEVSEDPIADAVEEIAQAEGISSDAETEAALAALGL